jgi:hypothetical protein
MNPVAREEAKREAEILKHNAPGLGINEVKEILCGIFQRYGANPHTAWSNAQEIYAEVYSK